MFLQRWKQYGPQITLLAFLLGALLTTPAHARLVTEEQVAVLEDGYQIDIKFLIQLRYQSYSPPSPSDQFRIQLKPVSFRQLTEDEIQELRKRLVLGWDKATGIPLKEMVFEGGDPQFPQILLVFEHPVTIEVRNAANLLGIVITVKKDVTHDVFKHIPPEVEAPDYEAAEDSKIASLMNDANGKMQDNNFNQAIRLYRQAMQTSQGIDRQRIREYYGYALEQTNQWQPAKEQYEKYMAEYPDALDAPRVKKRLDRLIKVIELGEVPVPEKKIDIWKRKNYGVLSSFYFRDQTTPEGGSTTTNRSEFITDLDLYSKHSNANYDIRGQASVSLINKLLSGQKDIDTISTLSLFFKEKKNGFSGKIGRQFKGTEGLLDIFDGAYLSYKLKDKLKVNSFFGYPVDDTERKKPDTDRRFAGVSVNLGSFQNKLDVTAFFINQENHRKTDRRAIGGELSFYESNRALYASIDYDVFFDSLNVFFMNGWWTLPTDTTISFSYDQRNNPSLTMNNALIEQSATELSSLFGQYTLDELKRIAEDRTAISKSLTMSATQKIREDVQLTGNFTAFTWEGTETSAGVTGFSGTGTDYFYSVQLLKNNFVKEKDAFITDLSFSDTANYYGYAIKFSLQYPLTKKLRLVPELRFDYRDQRPNSNRRFLIRPGIEIDYRFKKWLRFEMDIGTEWIDEKIAGDSSGNLNLFLRVGFVINF